MADHTPPNPVLLRLHAEYCRAIANETRLAILYELAGGERSVGDLAEALGVSMANVSQHLRRMRTAGAVGSRREKHTVYYFAAEPRLMMACQLIRDALIERHAADTALMKHPEPGLPSSR